MTYIYMLFSTGRGVLPNSPDRREYPHEVPIGGGGTPARSVWVTPPPPIGIGWWYPLQQDRMGYPTPPSPPPPPRRQSSITSTCYVTGGMPLAFMQEDFLVRYFSSRPLSIPRTLICRFTLQLCFFHSCLRELQWLFSRV